MYHFPIKFVSLTIHSYNFLFALNFVPSPYQICPFDYSLIQLFYLHTTLYLFPIKFASITINSNNILFALNFVLSPYQICPLTIHSYNTLFAYSYVPSPYQICPYDCTLIQLHICTQVWTFSLLSNLPLPQFTHTIFCLHSILYSLHSSLRWKMAQAKN